MNKPGKEALSVKQLAREHPGIEDLLREMGVPLRRGESSSLAYLCEEAGVDPRDVFERLAKPLSPSAQERMEIERITVLPGTDKKGKKEHKEPIVFARGEIVAVVGPTGSGKSLLLSDIEGLVQTDSPSGRTIHLNGRPVDDEMRIHQTNKPIAQISQSMNYILDLTVDEFLDIHIESRNTPSPRGLKRKIIQAACSLCGEPFGLDTHMVTLSGGQARSLMIVDSIYIGQAPVILVDEIENAGIEREKAIALLLEDSNITIIATHDPLIALMAHRRIILKNGGIAKIIEQSDEERGVLEHLMGIEQTMSGLKAKLRAGETLRM